MRSGTRQRNTTPHSASARTLSVWGASQNVFTYAASMHSRELSNISSSPRLSNKFAFVAVNSPRRIELRNMHCIHASTSLLLTRQQQGVPSTLSPPSVARSLRMTAANVIFMIWENECFPWRLSMTHFDSAQCDGLFGQPQNISVVQSSLNPGNHTLMNTALIPCKK